MFKLRQLRCSFCWKDETEVSKLVAGPRVYICDVCVTVASRMMEGDPHDGNPPVKVEPTVWRKLSARVRQVLQGGDARRDGSLGVSG